MATQLSAGDGHAGYNGGRRLAARAWLVGAGRVWLFAGLLLGSGVPFTLVVMWPTNKRLEEAGLETSSEVARDPLVRWGRLHGIRAGLSLFALLLMLLAGRSIRRPRAREPAMSSGGEGGCAEGAVIRLR